MTDKQAPDLELLRAAFPAPELSAESLARMRTGALGELHARPRRRVPRPGRVGLAAAVVTLVAGVGITVAVLPAEDGSTPGADVVAVPGPLVGADTPARETLVVLAAHTADLRPLAIRAGQFVYSHVRGQGVNEAVLVRGTDGQYTEYGPDDVAQVQSESETRSWQTADGLRTVRRETTTDVNARPLTDQDARKLAGKPWALPAPHTMVFPGPPGDPKGPGEPAATPPGVSNPTPAWVASLPTDPQRLLEVFRADAGSNPKHSDAYLTFKTVVSFAARADALLTPAVRTALYQAIGSIPGIERTPGQTDLAGRPGVAVGRTDEGVRTEIILDPVTSRVLGTRMVAAGRAGVPAGTVLGWSTNDQRVVDAIGATS
ncbi:CU044_5270 family protein [Amycolatopsis sp. H6(2020)]|nr:CU044_5270 family protein [Amycolatopsis sp. H6(2020)]